MNERINIERLMGSVVVDSAWHMKNGRLVGVGRSRRYDRNGLLVETTPWVENGVTLDFADPPRRGLLGWWDRRKRREKLLKIARTLFAEVLA